MQEKITDIEIKRVAVQLSEAIRAYQRLTIRNFNSIHLETHEILHFQFLAGRRLSSITYIGQSHFAPQPFKSLYLNHFSSEWTEIWHDESLDGMDQV